MSHKLIIFCKSDILTVEMQLKLIIIQKINPNVCIIKTFIIIFIVDQQTLFINSKASLIYQI